jgi:ABC-2 type transport system permease protein
MAGLTATISMRAQLSAVASLRWNMFINSLRSKRGQMELASRIFVTLVFALGAFGAFALATGFSWYFISQEKPELFPILFWPVFFLWQVIPIMATAFTSNPDSTELLRFPLTYRSFFLIRLAYGLFDPASFLGCAGLFGVFFGIGIARPLLLPWSLVVLLTFALFNLVLMQSIFAWLERWLAQRRTREIMGIVFILFMLSFQLIGPMMQRYRRRPNPEFSRIIELATQAQAALPPGLAADALARVARAQYMAGLSSLLFLGSLTLATGYLFHLRLRQQFHGENLSEAAAPPTATAPRQSIPIGWNLPGLPQSATAVFEKEIRYLLRSGPMLLTLIMPIFMLIIFRLGPMSQLHHASFLSHTSDMAFPAAAAYGLLVLTNLVFNSFGGDAAGMQFFYASPATFQHIVLGKNLMHAFILAANTLLAWIAVAVFYGPPMPSIAIATLAGLLFAAPLNFTAGNLLSLYSPKKRDMATFSRQNASQTTVLISFGMQIVTVGVGAAVFAIARLYHNLWIASLIFLVLAGISIMVYAMVLGRIDSIALERRETLLAELCRT